jgi:hypothetical protein
MVIIRTHGVGGYNAGCRCDICREARSIKRKQYQSEESKLRQKEYKKLVNSLPENKKRKSEYDRERHQKKYDSETWRWRNILRKYKLTKHQYEELLIKQNGVCAICHKKPNRSYLSVDHDHACCSGVKTCGKCVRGLLCQSCNSFLGRVNDDLTTVNAYLVRYAEKRGDAHA